MGKNETPGDSQKQPGTLEDLGNRENRELQMLEIKKAREALDERLDILQILGIYANDPALLENTLSDIGALKGSVMELKKTMEEERGKSS